MYDTIEGPIRAVNGNVLTIRAGGIGYAVRVCPQLVREYIENHSRAELLDQVLDEELGRYAEALERLGQ